MKGPLPYARRPPEVEALRLEWASWAAMRAFVGPDAHGVLLDDERLGLRILEGSDTVPEGHFVIRHPNGSLSAMSAESFEAAYKQV